MASHNILLIASLLALALFIAHTNCSREEDRKERCSKKIQSLKEPCEEIVIRMIENKEDEDVLKMKGINYIRKRREENLEENCCAQLGQVNMDCRCQALQEILDDLNDILPKKAMGDAKKLVKTLPKECWIASPLGCHLNLEN